MSESAASNSNENDDRSKRNIVKLLLILTIVFLVCYAPNISSDISYAATVKSPVLWYKISLTYSIVIVMELVRKSGKLQRNKQISKDLCWKVHDPAQSFVLYSHPLAELRNRHVFYWLVPRALIMTYCVCAGSWPKKRTKT